MPHLPRSSLRSMSALVGLIMASTSKPAKLLISLWIRFSWKEKHEVGNNRTAGKSQRSCRKVSFATQMEIASLQTNMQNKRQVVTEGYYPKKNSNTRLKRCSHREDMKGPTNTLCLGFMLATTWQSKMVLVSQSVDEGCPNHFLSIKYGNVPWSFSTKTGEKLLLPLTWEHASFSFLISGHHPL